MISILSQIGCWFYKSKKDCDNIKQNKFDFNNPSDLRKAQENLNLA
jgi:hypothetical protein